MNTPHRIHLIEGHISIIILSNTPRSKYSLIRIQHHHHLINQQEQHHQQYYHIEYIITIIKQRFNHHEQYHLDQHIIEYSITNTSSIDLKQHEITSNVNSLDLTRFITYLYLSNNSSRFYQSSTSFNTLYHHEHTLLINRIHHHRFDHHEQHIVEYIISIIQ